MTPLREFVDALDHYLDFAGRATRRQFWWWWSTVKAVALLLQVVLPALAGYRGEVNVLTGPFGPGLWAEITAFATSGSPGAGAVPFWAGAATWVWIVATFIPSVSIVARRLHDANFSARWMLLAAVPGGGIALLLMLARSSRPEAVRFGRSRESAVV